MGLNVFRGMRAVDQCRGHHVQTPYVLSIPNRCHCQQCCTNSQPKSDRAGLRRRGRQSFNSANKPLLPYAAQEPLRFNLRLFAPRKPCLLHGLALTRGFVLANQFDVRPHAHPACRALPPQTNVHLPHVSPLTRNRPRAPSSPTYRAALCPDGRPSGPMPWLPKRLAPCRSLGPVVPPR